MAGKTNINELARRYVTAVFELAEKGKELSKVAGDFEKLESLLATNKDFERLANSPIISSEDRINSVEAIGKKLKLTKTTINFLKVVADNGRLDNLAEIIEAFNAKVAAANGEVSAIVVTPTELSAATIKKIQTELSSETGDKVLVTQKIDESLIGGLVVKIGSKMYDYSVKAQLSKLKTQLKQAS